MAETVEDDDSFTLIDAISENGMSIFALEILIVIFSVEAVTKSPVRRSPLIFSTITFCVGVGSGFAAGIAVATGVGFGFGFTCAAVETVKAKNIRNTNSVFILPHGVGAFFFGAFSVCEALSQAASLPGSLLYLFWTTPSRIRLATIPSRIFADVSAVAATCSALIISFDPSNRMVRGWNGRLR